MATKKPSKKKIEELILAARNNKLNAVKKLLSEGISPDVQDEDDQDMAAMHVASVDAVKLLIEAGGDVNIRMWGGVTPLMSQLGDGGTEQARVLISSGADINAVDEDGQNVLHYCCASCSGLKEVEFITSFDVALDVPDRHGKTPLMVAAGKTGYSAEEIIPIISFLHAKGARIEIDGVNSALNYASDEAVLDWLSSKGANVNCALADEAGSTILMKAVSSWDTDKVRWLVKHGADRDKRNAEGKTALDIAKENDDADTIEVLG